MGSPRRYRQSVCRIKWLVKLLRRVFAGLGLFGLWFRWFDVFVLQLCVLPLSSKTKFCRFCPPGTPPQSRYQGRHGRLPDRHASASTALRRNSTYFHRTFSSISRSLRPLIGIEMDLTDDRFTVPISQFEDSPTPLWNSFSAARRHSSSSRTCLFGSFSLWV